MSTTETEDTLEVRLTMPEAVERRLVTAQIGAAVHRHHNGWWWKAWTADRESTQFTTRTGMAKTDALAWVEVLEACDEIRRWLVEWNAGMAAGVTTAACAAADGRTTYRVPVDRAARFGLHG